jgi:uncharacterized protein YdaU (DUF1376 family)
MNFYPRHVGDYARDAGHLTLIEHGVYTLLLDRLYATERPIPAGEPYRIVRAASRAERAAVDAVLAEFFTLTDDGWRNKRVDQEIERMAEKRVKAQQSAQSRWDANAMRTHTERSADAVRRQCSPITNNQTESFQASFQSSGVGRKGPVAVQELLKKGKKYGR